MFSAASLPCVLMAHSCLASLIHQFMGVGLSIQPQILRGAAYAGAAMMSAATHIILCMHRRLFFAGIGVLVVGAIRILFERVTGTAYCADKVGLFAIVVERFAQATDMHIDGA